MKYLSYVDSEIWLSRSKISVLSSRDLLVSQSTSNTRRTIFAPFPTEGVNLAHFAVAIARWMPTNRERMLWLKNWQTIPAFERTFFEAVRGSMLHLIDAPGHLFGRDEQEKVVPDEGDYGSETAMIAGFLLLIMCYDWEAYLVSDGLTDYAYISDCHVWLSSLDEARTEQGRRIYQSFGLNTKISE